MAAVETGWLIERQPGGRGHTWWDGAGWTTVANRAIRYARQLDADRALQALRAQETPERIGGAYVLEHQWGPTPSPDMAPDFAEVG